MIRYKKAGALDDTGRIVIPAQIRQVLGLTALTPLEILLENDRTIRIRAMHKTCIFCGEKADFSYNEIPVCEKCADRIKNKESEAGKMNAVHLTGRLVSEPELKQTQNGKSVSTIRIAVHSPGTEDVDFFNVVCWRQTAEFVCRNFTKGQWIELSCILKNHTYAKANGEKVYENEIVCQSAGFVGSKAPEKNAEPAESTEPQPQ